LETKQRILALRKLSLEYQKAIDLEKSKVLKELALTKPSEVSKADWYASAKKLRAYKLATKHFKPEFDQGLFNSPNELQNKLLSQARTQQRLPNGMQARKQVQKTLPPSFSNEPNKISAQLDSIAKTVFTTLDSLSKPTLDSFHFKPNPYAELFFIERFKPSFTWQNFLPQGPQPAVLELMSGIKFLWTPQLTPTFHLIYRQGLGSSLQQIQFTYQGYGFQLGLRRKVLEKGFVFAAWEGRSFSSESHTAWRGSPTIQSTGVLGLGYTAAISVLLLCDVKQLIAQRNYTAIRVQFNF
jgi:hypothetical protein